MIQGSSELTELFDLEPSEELLERFACALLQTYTCSHNDFTPEQQVGPGHAINITSDGKTSFLPRLSSVAHSMHFPFLNSVARHHLCHAVQECNASSV